MTSSVNTESTSVLGSQLLDVLKNKHKSAYAGGEMPLAGIQETLNNITRPGTTTDLNRLLQAVSKSTDARAAIYVYDIMKTSGAEINEASWVALQELERKRNNTPVIYTVPTSQKLTLTPARRIHKICKGPRTHARSEAAKEILPETMEWLQQQAPKFRDLHRSKQVKMLSKALKVDMDTARGTITKLKQKKLLVSSKRN